MATDGVLTDEHEAFKSMACSGFRGMIDVILLRSCRPHTAEEARAAAGATHAVYPCHVLDGSVGECDRAALGRRRVPRVGRLPRALGRSDGDGAHRAGVGQLAGAVVVFARLRWDRPQEERLLR